MLAINPKQESIGSIPMDIKCEVLRGGSHGYDDSPPYNRLGQGDILDWQRQWSCDWSVAIRLRVTKKWKGD
jgi:hypothetical protein